MVGGLPIGWCPSVARVYASVLDLTERRSPSMPSPTAGEPPFPHLFMRFSEDDDDMDESYAGDPSAYCRFFFFASTTGGFPSRHWCHPHPRSTIDASPTLFSPPLGLLTLLREPALSCAHQSLPHQPCLLLH
ncbi:hypothetical protein GUJ93_ZPchr0014g47173 [Zizania palustris]|uniref:Uncharacterized protein n=1 Tax=Zizania palustris TaxID=103762 RepID=A0A8J5T7M4_ZIZPA|nr:hypothetical protein GUJ93_ZPchr0014g47173 [Zizania palustris]